MEILSAYNLKVKIHDGDLIAFYVPDENNGDIYIRPDGGDKIYVSHVYDKNNLEKELVVNSAGFFSRDKDILPKGLEWRKYKK